MEAENIKAMLAHKYNEDKADYPAFIQPKLDGVRCLFTAKGAFSRANNQFMNVEHIEQDLKPVFDSCLLYTSPSPRDRQKSRMPSSA